MHTHQTAPTRFVEVGGHRFAYRRFGVPGRPPPVFNTHFTGTMDHGDPAVTDALATGREVVLFDNAEIGSSGGEVPTSVEAMAMNAIAFMRAIYLDQADVLGFSLGGLVAQETALQASSLVRKLVLVGTGPRGGYGMASPTPEAQAIFGAAYEHPDDVWLGAFFTTSATSQARGREFLVRFRLRSVDRHLEANAKVAPVQLEALTKWGAERPCVRLSPRHLAADAGHERRSRRRHLHVEFTPPSTAHPRRSTDPIPDANHGAQYQYPGMFVGHVSMFLDA